MARREKKPVHKVVMTEGKRNIIQQFLQEYDIETAEDIQDALKNLLGGTIKEMMEAEMDDHLGCQKSELIIPGLFEPPVRTLRFFRNYPFYLPALTKM